MEQIYIFRICKIKYRKGEVFYSVSPPHTLGGCPFITHILALIDAQQLMEVFIKKKVMHLTPVSTPYDRKRYEKIFLKVWP